MKYNKRIEFHHSSGKIVVGNLTITPREGVRTRFQLSMSSNDPFVEKSQVSGDINLEDDIKDLIKQWQVAVNKQLIEFTGEEKQLLVKLGFERLK